MKISSIFYGLAAYTLARSSASPTENNASNKLTGINNGTSNLLNNSNFLLTWSEEDYKNVPIVYPEDVSIAELPKDFFFKTSSWGDLAKQFLELPILFAQDESCPGVTQKNCGDSPRNATKHSSSVPPNMESAFGCKKFEDNHGTTILPTFNVDCTSDSIKPEVTPFIKEMKERDVMEVSTGHITATVERDVTVIPTATITHTATVDVTNPSEVEIIGVNCDDGVC